MLLEQATNNKEKFMKVAEQEINCSDCARNKNNGGNCDTYPTHCLFSPNTQIDLGKFNPKGKGGY